MVQVLLRMSAAPGIGQRDAGDGLPTLTQRKACGVSLFTDNPQVFSPRTPKTQNKQKACCYKSVDTMVFMCYTEQFNSRAQYLTTP